MSDVLSGGSGQPVADAFYSTAQGAPKAMQTLTLVSGGCTDAFSPQLEALDNIMELVQKFLAREVVNTNNGGKMEFKRRVFHKVRAMQESAVGVAHASVPVGATHRGNHQGFLRAVRGGSCRAGEEDRPHVVHPASYRRGKSGRFWQNPPRESGAHQVW